MGVAYTSLVGAPPSPLTLAFRDWYLHPTNGLLARRLANVPLAKTTTYFFARSARAGGSSPSNSNDGLDGLGFTLAGATYTASTRTITKASAFTSYSWQPNDLIYLSFGGGPAGLHKITSRTSNNAIVLAASADAREGSLAAPTIDYAAVVSSNGPKTTIAHASTLLNAAATNADLRFRFCRNHEWNETTGIVWATTHNLVTIDAYGNGNKPFWNRFATNFTAGWTQDGVTDRWTRTTVASVIWVREQRYRYKAYQEIANQGSTANNAALVRTTPLSFDVNGTTLGINAGTGVNPNTAHSGGGIPYEVSTSSSSTPAIYAKGDKIRVEGLRVEGWNQTHTGAAYSILLEGANGEELVCWDNDVLCGGYHLVGTTGPSILGGGIFTIGRCTVGYATPRTDVPGETMLNCFSPGTGAEMIVHECSVPFGSLPTDAWVTTANPTLGRGDAYYGHTSEVGATLALYVNWGCTSGRGGEPYAPVSAIPTIGGVTLAGGVLTAARTFVVDFAIPGYPLTAGGEIAPAETVTINARVQVKPANKSSGQMGSSFSTGWLINSTVQIDCGRQAAAAGFPSGLAIFASTDTPTIWHSHLELTNCANVGGLFAFGTVGAAKLFNSIATIHGDPFLASRVGVTNSASNLGGNAYGGYSSYTGTNGYDADPAPVSIGDTYIAGGAAFDARMYGAAIAIPTGESVRYDQRWNLRPVSPSIGPIERYSSPGVSMSRVVNA